MAKPKKQAKRKTAAQALRDRGVKLDTSKAGTTAVHVPVRALRKRS